MGFTEKWINNFFFHAQSQKVKIDIQRKKEPGQHSIIDCMWWGQRVDSGKGGSQISWDGRKAAVEASPCIPPSAWGVQRMRKTKDYKRKHKCNHEVLW